MPLEREINRAASICLISRTFPERSIALSNIAAKSLTFMLVVATAPSRGCSCGRASIAAVGVRY